MRFLATLLVLVVGLCGRAAVVAQEDANIALRDFIAQQIDLFRGQMEGSVGVDEVDFSLQDPKAIGTYTNITVRNINMFGYDLSADLDRSSLTINFTTNPHVEGNYTLEGVSNNSIIVRGRGVFQLVSSGIEWPGNCSLEVDSNRHVSVRMCSFKGNPSPPAFGSFDGIDGYEIIGENITSYLDAVASKTITLVDGSAFTVTWRDLETFLNLAFLNVTLDEIIGNTTVPTTSRPDQPDYVIDLISDLEGSGWSVPTVNTCAYSVVITGFLCNGVPVGVRDPSDGRGFWMSPCRGSCTFEYKDTTRLPKALGVQASYSDFALTARISVKLWRLGSVVREFDLRKDGGTYNELDFSMYSYDTVSVSMENDGDGGFGILDTLRVFNS